MRILRLSREAAAETLKKGTVFHSPFFSIRYQKNTLNKAFLAVAASKKEEKTAVGRNRMKRRIRAAFAKAAQTKDFRGNFMVFAKKPSKISPFDDLYNEVEAFLGKQKPL